MLDQTTGQPSSNFIFQHAGISGLLFDPRVEWDPYSERFWIIYTGGSIELVGGASQFVSRLYVAVTTASAGSQPESLTSSDWHIYDGTDAFDLTQGVGGSAYNGGADHPVISFDANNVYLTSLDLHASETTRQAVVVIPRAMVAVDRFSAATRRRTPPCMFCN